MPPMVTLKGSKELRGMLQGLAPALQKKVWRTALRAGAIVLRDAARAAAPVRTDGRRKRIKGKTRGPGFLKRNIIAKVLRQRKNGQLVAIAGTRAEAYYGRLVETGWNTKSRAARVAALPSRGVLTTRRRRRGSGTARQLIDREFGSSQVPPRPWLRPAVHANAQRAIDAVGATLRAEIPKVARETFS